MNNPNDCTPFEWTQPPKSRQCVLKPDQKVVDFNIIFTGLEQDIDQVIANCLNLPIDKTEGSFDCISMKDYLTEEVCAAIPALRVFQPLQIRLYDLIGEESEDAVWQAIKQVYDQAAKENKLIFADPNFITGDPEGGSGGSGGILGGPEGGSGGSGGILGGPEGGSGGSGGVLGGPDGNVGGKSSDEAFMEHWAFYPTRGINLETGRGLRINSQNKGQNAEVFIFDTVDKRIDDELDLVENYPDRSSARSHFRIKRGYPPEPLELCISSPAGRFQGTSQRNVYLESYRKTRVDEHGLFVAGLVHRIAPLCRIHLVDILNQYGQGELFGFLRALMLLVKRGVEKPSANNPKPLRQTVVNLSLGVTLSEEAMIKVGIDSVLEVVRDAINGSPNPQNPLLVSMLDNMLTESHYVGSLRVVIKLIYELGAFIVAASGNDSAKVSGDLPGQIPARYPEVISVAASVFNGKKANYSNRGDVLAPGGGSDLIDVKPNPSQNLPDRKIDESEYSIFSLVPKVNEQDSGYALWRGTSFATPMVSGLIALLIEKIRINDVKISHNQIKKLLANRSRDGVIDIQMALDGVTDT